MRGQQGNGIGARRRFLAEQAEHMAEIEKALKPTEYQTGNRHEQYSAEGKRRKIVASEMGYAGVAAAGTTAASLATGAKVAGTSMGQNYLKTRSKLARDPAEKATYDRVAQVGRWARKSPVKASAVAAGGAATATVAGRIARMRGNEEAGISQGIGRLKAGTQYKTDQQRIAKSARLLANALVELDRGAPGYKKAVAFGQKHKRPLQIGGGLVATGSTLGVTGNRADKRRKETVATREALAKREPLRTSINRQDADRMVRQYGLKGSLPKGLTREQKIAAYEARYVKAGGRKAEKWSQRAERSEKIRSAGVGAGALAGAAFLGAKAGAGRHVARVVNRTPARKINRSHLETAGVAVGTLTAAAEVDAMRARRKRSSYASAPGGVAASALRRMRAYTPEEKIG